MTSPDAPKECELAGIVPTPWCLTHDRPVLVCHALAAQEKEIGELRAKLEKRQYTLGQCLRIIEELQTAWKEDFPEEYASLAATERKP